MRRLGTLVMAVVAVLTAACADETAMPAARDDATSMRAAATEQPPETSPQPAARDADDRVMRVLAHDYFSGEPHGPLFEAFEREHGIAIEWIFAGDANQVAAALLNGSAPQADLVVGIDNLLFPSLAAEGLLTPYESPRRVAIDPDILAQIGDDPLVTPVDYGYVTLNFDSARGAPPASWDDLTSEAWRGELVVQDPSRSSPGLQFFLTTIAAFGEDGATTWRDFWTDLRANDVLITSDWGEAYADHFSGRNPEGKRSLVVSYTTSPAAEAERAQRTTGILEDPPTQNVILGPLFRQVEVAAILEGTEYPEEARAFIDLLLSDGYQKLVPPTDHVYPVVGGLPTPEWWRYADVEVETAELAFTPADIERWIVEWGETMGE